MEMDKKKFVGFNQLNFATASGVDTTAIFGFVLLKPVPVAGFFFFSTLFAIWESKEVRPPWKNYIRLPICSLSNILLILLTLCVDPSDSSGQTCRGRGTCRCGKCYCNNSEVSLYNFVGNENDLSHAPHMAKASRFAFIKQLKGTGL